MQLFLDSADLKEIQEISSYGLIDGVTTNPSILAKLFANAENDKTTLFELITQICQTIDGDVSIEVSALDYNGMITEGIKLNKIAKNIVIKLPLSWESLKACRFFYDQNIKTNLTLCFSPGQALLAAKARASYISPFIGRLDDIGYDGLELIKNIKQIYSNYPEFETKILAASIRHEQHFRAVSLIGADVATLPYKLFKNLLNHPLTKQGIELFDNDWKKAGLKI